MDEEQQERLTDLVNQIFARAKQEGAVVTIHKHYAPATAYAARGFFFAVGASTYIGLCFIGAQLWRFFA